MDMAEYGIMGKNYDHIHMKIEEAVYNDLICVYHDIILCKERLNG